MTADQQEIERLAKALVTAQEALREARQLVDEQAEDEALWPIYRVGEQPIVEAYLQQELRRLHAAVERASLEESDAAELAAKDEALRESAEKVLLWIGDTGQMLAHSKVRRPERENEIVRLAHSLARAALAARPDARSEA